MANLANPRTDELLQASQSRALTASEVVELREEGDRLNDEAHHALEPDEYDFIAQRREAIWQAVKDYVMGDREYGQEQ